MVHIEIKAKVNRKFVENAVNKAIKLVKPPRNLKVFVIDNVNQCPFVVSDLEGFARKGYEKFCRAEKTSMSVSAGRHQHLIVFITKEEGYLRKNNKALIGTLIHELMHTQQRKRHIDELIYNDLEAALEKWLPKFRKLKIKGLDQAIRDILDESGYALKDIYDNYELTKAGLGDYLLEDYANLYKGFKKCPVPLEFEKLHAKVKRNINALSSVMRFQISLLAVVIPFLMWHKRKAQLLAAQIEGCYRISITKVTYEFDDLINYVAKNYAWKNSFRRKYFDIIMEKVYALVT